jgi:2-haloalkanoic acid dehalogenase type II
MRKGEQMVKAIIFDAYGTLIDTADGSIRAVRSILAKYNTEMINAEDFYRKWKYYHRFHIDSLKSFIKEEDIFTMDLIELFKEYQIEGDPHRDVQVMLNTLGKRNAYPETNTVLDALRPDYDLFIGSISDQESLLTDISRNNIVVNKCFSSEYLRIYKPRREFFEKILKEINMKSEEVVFVGDSIIDDVLGPSSLGMKTVWVNRKKESAKADAQPNHEISDLWPLIGMDV